MSFEDIEKKINYAKKINSTIKHISKNNIITNFIDSRVSQHQKKRKETKETFEEFISSMESIDNKVKNKINKILDVQIKSPSKYKKNVDKLIKERNDLFDSFKKEESNEYLKEDEISKINSFKNNLDDYERLLEEKISYLINLNNFIEEYNNFYSSVKHLHNYNDYLTKSKEKNLKSELDKIKTSFEKIKNSIKNNESTIDKYSEKINELMDLLNNYNKKFIDKEIEEFSYLFTDVGGSGLDLNRRQCEAIIKNDNYNQVIAAAGTGKTLVLTYRIKYLVDKGVAPNRIVALTYTKEASKEMKIRLKENFNITDVKVSTIHSFAYKIVQNNSKQKLSVVGDNEIKNIIENILKRFLKEDDNPFLYNYYQFLKYDEVDYITEEDFEDKSEYVAEMKNKKYHTLKGEEVKSRAEKAIADFLLLHDIDYQYEKTASWADKHEEKRVYQPDFYIPDYDIYIEHLGVNKEGEVPAWFEWTTEQYQDKIKWAREQFKKHDKNLIETFDYNYHDGILEKKLYTKLTLNKVNLNKMKFNDYIDEVFEHSKSNIIDSFMDFISNAKTFNIAPNNIKPRLNKNNKRQYYFGMSAAVIYKNYNQKLEENNQIDFNDMIYKAYEILKEDPEKYYSMYDHMLVDEFQDVAESHINIIKQFFEKDSKVKLFCVGDDWQSIYSFQGSEPKFFIDFNNYFDESAKTYLTENFRCPKTVLDAGNQLINNNEHQISKKVEAKSGRDTTPYLHILDPNSGSYDKYIANYTVKLIKNIIDNDNAPDDIMVLCRYDDGSPYIRNVKKKLKSNNIAYRGKNNYFNPEDSNSEPENAVSVYSVHQSKGREAKHIIVLHVTSNDCYSFPVQNRVDELIEPVQKVDIGSIEEERRLFYVAITRAENDLHILTQKDNESPFIEEIRDFLEIEKTFNNISEVGSSISFTAKVRKLFKNNHESQRQAGVLEDNYQNTLLFVSWENSNSPIVKEDVWYRFDKVQVNEFNNQKQIVLNGDTKITNLYDETIK